MFHDQQTGKKKVSKEGRCIHCDKPSTHVSLGIRFCTECVQAMKKVRTWVTTWSDPLRGSIPQRASLGYWNYCP